MDITLEDDSTNNNTTFSQAVKSAYSDPAAWMYKYGPIIWFGVLPVVIGVIIYLVFRKQQKNKEERILRERAEDVEF